MTNFRFVRDSGYKAFTAILSKCHREDVDICHEALEGEISNKIGSDKEQEFLAPICKHVKVICEHLSSGLEDNWAIVRLSSTLATKEFFYCCPKLELEQFYTVLLPKLCLNRYFPAEGVKLQSQKAWKEICGDKGRSLLSNQISGTVQYYVAAAQAENHAVREAACHCMGELAMKLDKDVVLPYLPTLIDQCSVSVQDQVWPVRDVASLTASLIIKCFPDQCQDKSQYFLGVFLKNMKDSVPSVRQGAALSLANMVSAYGESVLSTIISHIKDGFKGVKDQTSDSDLNKSKNESDNSLLKTSMMNKGDLGGCTEAAGVKITSQPWEVAEGCVLALAELSKQKDLQIQVCQLLPDMFDSCHYKHYPAHLSYCTTCVNKFSQIISNMDKKYFKPFLEFDVIFYCIESDNNNARIAGEDCLRVLSKILGPNILRGRVENSNPNMLSTHDRVMSGVSFPKMSQNLSNPSVPSFRPPQSQVLPIPSRGTNSFSTLGGTPPT